MRPPRLFLLCVLFHAAGLLSSCSLPGLHRHVTRMEERGGVTVEVTPPPKAGGPPTYALAWRMVNGARKDSAGFQEVRADGFASFSLLTANTYRVGAFTDENGNGAYDAGEPLALEREVKPVPFSDPAAAAAVWKLRLTRDHGLADGAVIQPPEENKKLGGKISIALGDLASLDEKRFAEDTGGSGLWRPLNFLTGNTPGIYFTEPYDAKRIPVVLVYGIGGSPQDWRYFMEHMDRRRHQLWFYHYPSGMRLVRVSNALAAGLRILKQRHGFTACSVVAHSMGGLVSHAAITRAVAAEGVNFIPEFVSISTPWGGHRAAESGIRHLRKPVPSWLDVVPDSGFLRRIYATPLPGGTTHHLIYGSIGGTPFYLKGANDGVVTVVSETDGRISQSTESIRHFRRGHVEILNDPATLEHVLALLGETSAVMPAKQHQSRRK